MVRNLKFDQKLCVCSIPRILLCTLLVSFMSSSYLRLNINYISSIVDHYIMFMSSDSFRVSQNRIHHVTPRDTLGHDIQGVSFFSKIDHISDSHHLKIRECNISKKTS